MRLSTSDIQERLAEETNKITSRTVERILKDAGYGKLKLRTNKELGITTSTVISFPNVSHLTSQQKKYLEAKKATNSCIWGRLN